MKFLLDTNSLLIPGKFKLDIFRELEKFGKPELYTLELIIQELEKISQGSGPDSRHAKLGLGLINKKKVKVLESQGNTDSEIIRIALKEGMFVCTQDRELIKKLRDRGVKIISLRQKKYLTKL